MHSASALGVRSRLHWGKGLKDDGVLGVKVLSKTEDAAVLILSHLPIKALAKRSGSIIRALLAIQTDGGSLPCVPSFFLLIKSC